MLHLYFVTELGFDKMTEHILFYKDIYDYHDTNNWNIMLMSPVFCLRRRLVAFSPVIKCNCYFFIHSFYSYGSRLSPTPCACNLRVIYLLKQTVN